MIEIQNINKRFGSFQALHDVSAQIERGQVVVICGPSGSGKSTLIKCVNGLEKIDGGRIVINGKILRAKDTDMSMLRAQVGMVFQNFELFPHLTILQNLTLAQQKVLKRSEKDAIEKAMALLDRVGLLAQTHKYPAQLSGGQQQRVAIARALAMDPIAMLFDEPTSALDPEMIQEVLEVMVKLAKDGMTMLCVTHEMGFARQVADRVIFMDEGRLVEDCSKLEFFSTVRSERSQQFLAKILTH